MKKAFNIYMIMTDGKEVYIDSAKTEEQANRKVYLNAKKDDEERRAGYTVPSVTYIYR